MSGGPKQSIPKKQLYMLMGATLIIGCFSTMSFKYENTQSIQNSEGEFMEFDHPFMQTFVMYIGEFLCLPIFLYLKYVKKDDYEKEQREADELGLKTKINPFLLLIPTSCDFTTSTLQNFGLYFLAPSVYSMMRGGNILVTCLFSVLFLKKKLYRHHYLGITLLVFGLFIVGLVSVLSGDSQSSHFGLGICFIVLSFFFYSTQLVVEEKFFRMYALNPFQVVGIEGIFGLILTTIVISIVSFIPCSINFNPAGKLEDVSLYFQQVFTFHETCKNIHDIIKPCQPLLFCTVIIAIIAILFLNAAYMSITKYADSVTRQLISLTSPLLIWILSMSVGWESFLWGQLFGFMILACGNFIYNEILIIPFFAFNSYTKKALEQQSLVQSQIDTDNSVVTQSEVRMKKRSFIDGDMNLGNEQVKKSFLA